MRDLVQRGKNMNHTDSKKVGFIHSIGMKIVLLTICAAFIATAICEVTYNNFIKETTFDKIANNMEDLANAYGSILDQELEAKKADISYSDLLENVQLRGIDGSYAYLVDQGGTMLYHPTAEKIGQPVENSVVKGLVAELAAGKKPENGFVSYEFNGEQKYAAYAIQSDNSILVISADEKNVMTFYTQTTLLSLKIYIFNLIIFAIVGLLFSKLFTAPILKLTQIIQKIAAADFRMVDTQEKINQRKDEIGLMGNAISYMRSNTQNLIRQIFSSSQNLEQHMADVNQASAEISDMCSDTSSTTEELAAGMQETSAAAETINGNIEKMQQEANEMHSLSVNGTSLSESILDRASQLNQTTIDSDKRTREMYESVRQKTNTAIEDAKAVSKINELTAAIMSISSQTSLLALNANIEAARAGDAGKGFAVVATEIGSLANQSSEAVSNINGIVSEVNEVVARMSETLTDSLDFLENVVIKDYSQFTDVSVQYSEDATSFKDSMSQMETSVQSLTSAIHTVADSLSGISSTIEESTVGVTEIAAKSSDIVMKTSDNGKSLEACTASLETLQHIANAFKID